MEYRGKKAIAQEAVKYIRDSHSIMVYGGSTTGHLGFYLTQGRIITNLPDLCRILRMRFPTGDGPQVILTGGEFDFRTGNLEGPALRRSLEIMSAMRESPPPTEWMKPD